LIFYSTLYASLVFVNILVINGDKEKDEKELEDKINEANQSDYSSPEELREAKEKEFRTEKMFLKIFFGTGMLAALLITLSIKQNCWELLDAGFSMLCFFTGFLIFGVGSELKKKNMKQADFNWCAFIIFLGLIIIILTAQFGWTDLWAEREQ